MMMSQAAVGDDYDDAEWPAVHNKQASSATRHLCYRRSGRWQQLACLKQLL
jgi:hypothetical protein